ncbi:phosphatase [Opitutus sp. ER46]|uniref:Ppx/GppA phosphatase family protein n=1 Tax=Opitutus sp. ER46 TaxID=2161864 RepID=UPI000D31EBCE|nr:phosphatase [Opitutus sp. ER46]PTX98914.1 phosphatase [Opitutus sp. ER46]
MVSAVAVIDIGSNSIKLLIAKRGEGSIVVVHSRSLDARISAGISKAEPELSEDGMATGLDAIRTLLADAKAHHVRKILLVATSAVRDARNGPLFRARVHEETGHEVRILTGDEEARLIGRGLACDPALGDLQNFYVFDLGGGSLECLAFRHRQLVQAASLQLGCVRLTEAFVKDVTRPLGRGARYRIMQHVHDELVRSPFKFDLGDDAVAVGTGGTMATVRAIIGARDGIPFEQTPTQLPVAWLRVMFAHLGRLPLDERRTVPGLPPARADVFPTALVTFVAVADVAGVQGFRHSLYNLRYGLAAEALLGASH